MSTEPRTSSDDGRFDRAAKAVADAATTLTPPTAREARARQQRHNARVVGVVALVACLGLVSAIAATRRADTRELAAAAGPLGSGSTPGSNPGSTPGSTTASTPGSTPVSDPVDPTATTEVASPPLTTTPSTTPPTTSRPAPSDSVPPTTVAGDAAPKRDDVQWEVEAKGSYAGIGHYRLFTGQCPDLKQDLDNTLVLDSGPTWALHADYCATIDKDNVWSGEGPFTLTVPGGETMTGILTSRAALPTGGVPYGLKITGGTGQYNGAEGSCSLTINLHETSFGEQAQDGTFDCHVRLAVPASTSTPPPG